MKIIEKHISLLKAGDLILHQGEVKTLSPCFLKRSSFMGITIWGDSYQLGQKPVKVVVSLN